MKIDHLFVDIGAKTEAQAEKKVTIGDIAKFSAPFVRMGSRLSSPAMDNRAGCIVLVELIEKLQGNEDDVYFVFTTQEEVGLRGAKTAAFGINPDMGLSPDVTPAGDTPDSMRFTVDIGKGAAIKIKDNSHICNPMVVKFLLKAAEQAGVITQREVLTIWRN